MTQHPVNVYEVDGLTPSRVAAPASVAALSDALRACASDGVAAIPWGGGSRMSLGNLPRRYDVAIDVTGMNRIVEYEPADLTVIVEAGMSIAALQAALAEKRQRLAFDPPYPRTATIGGSLASNAVGPLRSAFGGVRDLVIGMKIVQADGTVTKSGGKVVKNVSGYDLMRPHIGAIGTLGVIAEIAFKLVPMPHASAAVAGGFETHEAARNACVGLLKAPFQPERFICASGDIARKIGTAFGASPAAPFAVLVQVAAGEKAVARMSRASLDSFKNAGAVWSEAKEGTGEGIWNQLDPALDGPPLISMRATLKPLDAFGLLEKAASRAGSAQSGSVLHVGFGTLLVHWSPAGNPPSDGSVAEAREIVESTRTQAKQYGAPVVVERCPAALKKEIDVWGEPGAVAIMRSMKKQFDPGDVLNPGRFVAGI